MDWSLAPPSDRLRRSTVDGSSPFRSVKEAITTYGDQLLPRKLALDSERIAETDFVKASSNGEKKMVEGDDGGLDLDGLGRVLKKVEGEVEEAKRQIKLLKERESQTEIALASMNAELHRNMSKIAGLEASEAAHKVKFASRSPMMLDKGKCANKRLNDKGGIRDTSRRIEDQPTLEQVLSFGACEGYFTRSKKVTRKKSIGVCLFECMR